MTYNVLIIYSNLEIQFHRYIDSKSKIISFDEYKLSSLKYVKRAIHLIEKVQKVSYLVNKIKCRQIVLKTWFLKAFLVLSYHLVYLLSKKFYPCNRFAETDFSRLISHSYLMGKIT